MKYISGYYKLKYVFASVIIGFLSTINGVAQMMPAMGVDSAFKHINASNIIYYTSGNLKLKGYLYKPKGKGPFPVYIWNHGDEKTPDINKPLMNFWVKHGYIYFMPIRSGQGDNPGPYIRDEEKQIRRRKEMEMVQWAQVYALHQKANEDVLAALKWIKQQPFADSINVVVSGSGYGGIQVLLTAQKDAQALLGIKSFIAFSPASETWSRIWGDSLKQAINRAKRPIFILQVKDAHSPPSPIDTLGSVLEKKGFPNRYKVYPNPQQGEPEFPTDLNAIEQEMLKYLKDCSVKRKK